MHRVSPRVSRGRPPAQGGGPGRAEGGGAVTEIRVVVVDDHPFVRDALTDLLQAAGGISVVGQCADGSEVADAVRQLHPDVLLLDLQMPVVDGLTAASVVRTSHPEVRIVFLTGGLSSASVRRARAIDAAGYLLKDDDPADLPGHVRAVAAGGAAWHPRAAALLHDAGRA
ncbi:response regulator transcription factor [Blastococcus sp. MG754426]|nr:response regulator transcription factor [Blastococcus sp. MG754426]MCF6511689.1 response regulator transcription factor [Blastococcus sp. MG754427]